MFTTDQAENYTVDGQYLPLDLIIWRRYKRKTPGLVEATLDLNPGLADLGHFIPQGTVVTIPVDKPATPVHETLIRLW